MTAIATIVVYDPHGHHSSATQDQSTKIFSDELHLYNYLATDPQIYLSVGICSNNKSEVIEKVVHLPQVTSVFLCHDKKHCNREKNPLHHGKVRDEIPFNLDEDDLSNLEFYGHIANHENCVLYNNQEQFQLEIQALIRVKKQSLHRTQHPRQPDEPYDESSSAKLQTSTETKR
jgi:hypothetical protein